MFLWGVLAKRKRSGNRLCGEFIAETQLVAKFLLHREPLHKRPPSVRCSASCMAS